MIYNDINIEKIKKEVRATTLKVYLLLAKNKDSNYGIREIQRTLNFSSVSLASYHINKLEELKLVEKTSENRYKAKYIVPIGEFEDFFVLKGRYLPKVAFFLSFYTLATIMSILLLLLQQLIPLLVLLFSVVIIATISTWIQFWEYWTNKDEQEEQEED
ncbi:MAG: hypothetical protein HeimC3_38610 [Candidatus Heimdallarchaeota archaeon LC_3]|nr:MAG: hypothetical protein HeimC3_38610 [Candidatus Heimdallarchaeota archaeon LC_3]